MRRGFIILLLTSSLAMSWPAFAQDEDFGKAAVANVLLKKASAGQKKDVRTLEAPKPVSPYTRVEETPEDLDRLMAGVAEQNSALAAEFEQLLAKDPLNPSAPDWLSQIAEFHWQSAHYDYLRARRAWTAALDKCADDEDACPPEPQADYSQAINDYRRLLTQYPAYKHTDEVLFRLGDGLIRNRQPKEGVGYLHRLTQMYPDFKELDAAYLAMGEFYFSQKNTGTAQAAYQTILDKYPQSQYRQYAEYKLAWAYLNLADEESNRKAIELFKNVVASIDAQYASAIDSSGQIDENKLKVGEVSFRNQALNDLSSTYAELPGGWKDARDYLRTKLPPDKARDKIEQLGAILDGQGKYEEEIELFSDLIRENPMHAHLPRWYKAEIDAYKMANMLKEAERVTREALIALAPDQPWYAANESTAKSDILNANNFCAEQIYALALADMAAVEKVPAAERDALWADAEMLLRKALKFYNSEASSFDLHYSFAYVLDERSDAELAGLKKQYGRKLAADPTIAADVLTRLREAALSYQTAVDWKNVKDDDMAEQIKAAANRQVFVYANILAVSFPEWSIVNSAKAQNFVEEKRDSEIREKSALSKEEQDFVHSAEQYAAKYQMDDETPAFLWRAAEIYRSHNDYEQAAQRFDSIVTGFPNHQYAAVSVGSMFELYNKAKNYEKIEFWANWLREHENFKHYTAKELVDTSAFAIDKQAIAFADAGDIDKAVSTLMRIESSFPDRSDLVSAARLKAAGMEESRKHYSAAADLTAPLLDKADSPNTMALAAFRYAMNKYRISRFEEAGNAFESAALKYFALYHHDDADDAAQKSSSKKTVKSKIKSKNNPNHTPVDKSVDIPDNDRINAALAVFYGEQILRSIGQKERASAVIDSYLAANKNNTFELYRANDGTMTLEPSDVPILTQAAAVLERASIEAEEDPGAASKRLAEFDTAYQNPAMMRQIVLQQAQYAIDAKNMDEANKALKLLSPDETAWPRADLARRAYLAGRAAQIDFEQVQLEFPIRTLRKRIEEKAKKRQAAEKLFQQAIGYKNSSISTAAAYELAQMALHFRDAFRQLPPPKELENNPSALDEYNVWIEDELIFPAEDAAASLLEVAHQISIQLESYTSFAHKSAQTLADLKPDDYPAAKGPSFSSE